MILLESEGSSLQVQLLRRVYPDRNDYEDGNWIEAKIAIVVPGFKGLYGANLRAEDFKSFYNDIVRLINGTTSKAEFSTLEEGLYLEVILDVMSGIKWK